MPPPSPHRGPPSLARLASLLALAGLPLLLTACEVRTSTASPERRPAVIHLFDLRPSEVRADRELPAGLAELLDQPEVEIVGERIGSESFTLDTTRLEDLGSVFVRSTRFTPVGEPRHFGVSAEGELSPLESTGPQDAADEGRPRGPGTGVVGPGGVLVATGGSGERPPTIEVSYRARSEQVLAQLFSPRGEPGSVPLTTPLEYRHLSRRAAQIGPSSRLAWELELPPRATLELGLGVVPFGLSRKGDALVVTPGDIGSCELRVELRPLEPDGTGGPGKAEPVVLHTQRAGRAVAGRFTDVELDLEPWSGQRVELALVSQPSARVDGPAGVFPFWTEPVISGTETRGAPNVLLLLLDTLRADRLGCYGWERARTPNLDRLASQGARFDDATASAPWTLPSHASMFASLRVSEHGLWNRRQRLQEEVTTLAEVLRDGGYRTAAFTEGGFVRPAYGLAQGFEHFRAQGSPVEQTLKLAKEWIETTKGPWFCFAHTYLVHSPYDPPERHRKALVRPYDGELGEVVSPPEHEWGRHQANTLGEDDIRYLRDLYDAEVAHLDEAVGAFLATCEQAGLLDNTVLVVTSDHGEEFADHGHYNHGYSLYQEQLRVPLIVRYEPAFEPGVVARHPVQGIDLAPTLVELAGLPIPAAWQGVPLTVEPPDRPRPVFVPFLTRQDGSRCGVLRVGDLKYIDYPTGSRPSDPNEGETLFDLSVDPFESEDRLGTDAERWRTALAELWERHAQELEAEASDLRPELERELEALGYGGGE